MSKYLYHFDGSLPATDEIFVFGSNEAGRHGAGAAKAAYDRYGAKYGNGYGLQGRSYAIPTKDAQLKTLHRGMIAAYIEIFLEFTRVNPDKKFFMTRVGCGLAGFNDHEIAPLFINSPTNINFPETWKFFLED